MLAAPMRVNVRVFVAATARPQDGHTSATSEISEPHALQNMLVHTPLVAEARRRIAQRPLALVLPVIVIIVIIVVVERGM
jgi:hypothetical protein